MSEYIESLDLTEEEKKYLKIIHRLDIPDNLKWYLYNNINNLSKEWIWEILRRYIESIEIDNMHNANKQDRLNRNLQESIEDVEEKQDTEEIFKDWE